MKKYRFSVEIVSDKSIKAKHLSEVLGFMEAQVESLSDYCCSCYDYRVVKAKHTKLKLKARKKA